MLQLPETNLDQKWQNYLDTWQKEINAIASYSEKVEQAKAKYESKIKTVTFKNIRGTLETMCSGNRRCCYCEDSCADEVEHIRPKSLYPELVFVWENYLYSCGLCNPKKIITMQLLSAMKFNPLREKRMIPLCRLP